MILDPKKKAITLHTVKREFVELNLNSHKHLAMKVAMERCTTPKQISPLNSPVPMNEEIGRIHARMSEPGLRRKV